MPWTRWFSYRKFSSLDWKQLALLFSQCPPVISASSTDLSHQRSLSLSLSHTHTLHRALWTQLWHQSPPSLVCRMSLSQRPFPWRCHWMGWSKQKGNVSMSPPGPRCGLWGRGAPLCWGTEPHLAHLEGRSTETRGTFGESVNRKKGKVDCDYRL